jgi:hypothetical protein
MTNEKATLRGAAQSESAAAKLPSLTVHYRATRAESVRLTLAALWAALRDYSIAKADENTDEWWKSCADRAIDYLASLGHPFSADHVAALVPDPDHLCRWDARFHAAVRAGGDRPHRIHPVDPSKPSQGRSAVVRGR